MYTLIELRRLKPFLKIAAIARLLDMETDTLHKRIYRGSPELSEKESRLITEALQPRSNAEA